MQNVFDKQKKVLLHLILIKELFYSSYKLPWI